MNKKRYFITKCVRCGEMPLFLIFYRTRRLQINHCVMVCTFKNLKRLLKEKHGFEDPSTYGHILYNSHEEKPNDLLKGILKARYDFDLEKSDNNELRVF